MKRRLRESLEKSKGIGQKIDDLFLDCRVLFRSDDDTFLTWLETCVVGGYVPDPDRLRSTLWSNFPDQQRGNLVDDPELLHLVVSADQVTLSVAESLNLADLAHGVTVHLVVAAANDLDQDLDDDGK
jgi:hypothetical protein